MINIISQSTKPRWRGGSRLIGTRWGGRWVEQRSRQCHGIAGSPSWTSLTEGLPDLHQRANSIPHLACNPFQSLKSSKCGIYIEGLKKGRIHAKKKAWLLEVPSSWSIFHLLSLNYLLSVRVYRYHCSLPEFSVVQYFKTHRFP